jgi:hypothetical protein
MTQGAIVIGSVNEDITLQYPVLMREREKSN